MQRLTLRSLGALGFLALALLGSSASQAQNPVPSFEESLLAYAHGDFQKAYAGLRQAYAHGLTAAERWESATLLVMADTEQVPNNEKVSIAQALTASEYFALHVAPLEQHKVWRHFGDALLESGNYQVAALIYARLLKEGSVEDREYATYKLTWVDFNRHELSQAFARLTEFLQKTRTNQANKLRGLMFRDLGQLWAESSPRTLLQAHQIAQLSLNPEESTQFLEGVKRGFWQSESKGAALARFLEDAKLLAYGAEINRIGVAESLEIETRPCLILKYADAFLVAEHSQKLAKQSRALEEFQAPFWQRIDACARQDKKLSSRPDFVALFRALQPQGPKLLQLAQFELSLGQQAEASRHFLASVGVVCKTDLACFDAYLPLWVAVSRQTGLHAEWLEFTAAHAEGLKGSLGPLLLVAELLKDSAGLASAREILKQTFPWQDMIDPHESRINVQANAEARRLWALLYLKSPRTDELSQFANQAAKALLNGEWSVAKAEPWLSLVDTVLKEQLEGGGNTLDLQTPSQKALEWLQRTRTWSDVTTLKLEREQSAALSALELHEDSFYQDITLQVKTLQKLLAQHSKHVWHTQTLKRQADQVLADNCDMLKSKMQHVAPKGAETEKTQALVKALEQWQRRFARPAAPELHS